MNAYLKHSVLVDTEFALSMLSKEQFVDYHREENDDQCMDVDENVRLTDEDAKRLIFKIAKCKSVVEFQQLDAAKRNAYIHKLHENGMSIRQISRLTGISKRVVEWHI